MMVGHSPHVGQVLQELEQVTTKIEEVSKQDEHKQTASLQDQGFLKSLKHCNAMLCEEIDPSFLDDKKFSSEKMKSSIANALAAIVLFQRARRPDKAAQKDVDQMIVSLSANLSRFGRQIEDLKKNKTGRKVEEIHRTKEFGG